jgi:hypothetical protein
MLSMRMEKSSFSSQILIIPSLQNSRRNQNPILNGGFIYQKRREILSIEKLVPFSSLLLRIFD